MVAFDSSIRALFAPSSSLSATAVRRTRPASSRFLAPSLDEEWQGHAKDDHGEVQKVLGKRIDWPEGQIGAHGCNRELRDVCRVLIGRGLAERAMATLALTGPPPQPPHQERSRFPA